MKIVNVHEAKTHLSRRRDDAVNGEAFIIAKAGKPMVKVVPYGAPDSTQQRRLGFLKGSFAVPDDFDTMGAAEIQEMFGGR
jgi:antitoxin (DNA-binding transcriptional repressor) of toxin-antitoxin stability system